jgi:anti-anti-sigma regulatory factor
MADVRIFKLAQRRMRSDTEPLLAFLKEAKGQPVTLDMSDVARLDCLRLRTLLSAHRKWLRDGVPFKLRGLTHSNRDALRLLGVDPLQFEEEAA